MHPSLEPLVRKELNELLVETIICLVLHTQWVANLEPIYKSPGEIRLCIDFQNINKEYKKDSYHIPPME